MALSEAAKSAPSFQGSRSIGQDEAVLHLVAQTASPGCKQLAIEIAQTDIR